jgi:NAD dependent epimerase/dehydratase family enzyme
MKIFITGGTDFVGTYISKQQVTRGHKLTILNPPMPGHGLNIKGISYLDGNPTVKGQWQKSVPGHDVIINLAGASIFSRWTQKQKETIRSSRISTTRNLIEALPDNSKHITVLRIL